MNVETKRNRKFFLGANWKCNGSTAFCKDIVENMINDFEYDDSQLGKEYLFLTKHIDLMVMPGVLHLSLVQAIVNESVHVAAQNVSASGEGAFTGEVSADAIKDYRIEWVLIGHSERRNFYDET